jgi:hypothetical protein
VYVNRVGSRDESDHCSRTLLEILFTSVSTHVVDMHKYDEDLRGAWIGYREYERHRYLDARIYIV